MVARPRSNPSQTPEQDWHRRGIQAQDRRRPMQPDRPATERRRQPRRFRAATIACVPSAGNDADQWWEVLLVDVSGGGARILGKHSFAEQEVLKLRFGREDEQTAIVALVRVVHVHAQPDGNWVLGCQFVRELNDAELGAVLKATDPGGSVRGQS